MIQIPESLFVELIKYHVLGMEDSLPKIKTGLEQKYDELIQVYGNVLQQFNEIAEVIY